MAPRSQEPSGRTNRKVEQSSSELFHEQKAKEEKASTLGKSQKSKRVLLHGRKRQRLRKRVWV